MGQRNHLEARNLVGSTTVTPLILLLLKFYVGVHLVIYLVYGKSVVRTTVKVLMESPEPVVKALPARFRIRLFVQVLALGLFVWPLGMLCRRRARS